MGHLEIERDPKERSTLQLQRDLQNLLRDFRGGKQGLDLTNHPDALVEAVRANVEALHVELAELLDHLPWKYWKTYPAGFLSEERLEEAKFEVIDILHFVNNIFLALGMSDEDVREYYFAKHRENVRRQYGTYGGTKDQLPEEYR